MKKGGLAILLLASVLNGCKKEEKSDITPTVSNAITINSVSQFSGKIADTAYSYKEGVSNVEELLGSVKSLLTPPDSTTAIYQTSLTYASGSSEEIGINKGTMKFLGSKPEDSKFKSFCAKGTYNYSVEAASGIEVYWIDANGNKWSTSDGTADQTGSAFTITDIEEFMIDTDYAIKFKAVFNCKLYNSNGLSKTITDGIYVGFFASM